MNPAEKVLGAIPGTLHELAERTGYPLDEVLRQLQSLRVRGREIISVEDGVTRYPGRHRLDPEWRATTVYRDGALLLTEVEIQE